MNRDLAEVRRYWPRAVTMVSGEWYTAAGLKADLYHIGQVWQVTITTPGDAYRRHCQPTIAEAMRAAGFGVRPLGRFSFRRGWYELRRDIQIAMGFSPRVSSENYTRLTINQRPRKGARLGRRKRQSDATPETSPKWYAVAATYPRYELRHGAQVLTVVRYSRADGMWSTPRTGGFHTKEGAMRWEEMRLNLPDCPVAEVQP